MKNPFLIIGGDVSIFDTPLRKPFITALGSQVRSTNVGFTIRLSGGAEGYGEASSSIVLAHLKPKGIMKILQSEFQRIKGRDIRYLNHLISDAWKRKPAVTPAAAAFECALTDAWTRSLGLEMSEWFGGTMTRLTTDITISATSASDARQMAQDALRQGFRQLKVKVGTGFDKDWRRVSAIWDVARGKKTRVEILLDGNQGMTAASAMRLVEQCLKKNVRVTLLEQPLRAGEVQAMAELKRRCPIPLAADESAWSPQEVLQLLDVDAADIFNVKVAKTGLRASLDIISVVRAADKRLMIGCMRETAKGLDASVHLACGTGAFDFVDLDSDCLLGPGQQQGGFTREGPKISLSRMSFSGRS